MPLTRYPDGYVPLPRDVLTKALKTLCRKLDAQPRCTAPQQRFTRMWVVGSYARGAAHCGDLNVVLEAQEATAPMAELPHLMGGNPQLRPAYRAAIGSIRHVAEVFGSPSCNEHGHLFMDAVLIWDGTCSWPQQIASLKVDPTAKRFAKSDCAMAFDRIAGEHTDWHAQVQRLVTQQRLQVRLYPLSGLARATDVEFELYAPPQWEWKDLGRERMQLSRYALRYLLGKCQEFGLPPTKATWTNNGTLAMYGFKVLLHPSGLPSVEALAMEHPAWISLAVMPSLSVQGPNGAWELAMGAKHPLFQKATDVELGLHRAIVC